MASLKKISAFLFLLPILAVGAFGGEKSPRPDASPVGAFVEAYVSDFSEAGQDSPEENSSLDLMAGGFSALKADLAGSFSQSNHLSRFAFKKRDFDHTLSGLSPPATV